MRPPLGIAAVARSSRPRCSALLLLHLPLHRPPTLAPRIPAVRACATSAGDNDNTNAAQDESAQQQSSLSLTLQDSSDTLALGAQLAAVSRAGDTFLLHGDYGAGKTCLARGFLRHWYDDPTEQVTSPSYLIDNCYDDPDGVALLPGVAVHHMDLWRLPEGKVAQLVDLPHVFSECVSLIEWPQRLGEELTPKAYLDVRLENIRAAGDGQRTPSDGAGEESAVAEADDEALLDIDDDQPRVATLTARGEVWEARLDVIREAWDERCSVAAEE